MKLLVCGGRYYNNKEIVFSTLNGILAKYPITEIIQGGATGADALAREWAEANAVACITYHASWKTFGKSAGPIRNEWMLKDSDPDDFVAFPGGKGTANMIKLAREAGLTGIIIKEPLLSTE